MIPETDFCCFRDSGFQDRAAAHALRTKIGLTYRNMPAIYLYSMS